MPRKNPNAITGEQLHELAGNLEDWGMTANNLANQMQKGIVEDLGDELLLLSRLSIAAENILGLHRQVLGSVRMKKSTQELEDQLRKRSGK
jgi:hypothetical protein